MDSPGVAARITALLDSKGWSARELARRAGLGDNAKVSNLLKRLRGGENVNTATLTAIAGALGVTLAYLLEGGDESSSTPPASEGVAVSAPLPPGCVGSSPTYPQRKAAARRIATDVPDEWVWHDLATVDTMFLGTREPSAEALAALARLIQRHGKPT